MSQTEVALATLVDDEGNCHPILIAPAYAGDDCAFVPLGDNDAPPPALTISCVDGNLVALYHGTGPLDMSPVECQWEGEYAVVVVPEGVVRVPASAVRV